MIFALAFSMSYQAAIRHVGQCSPMAMSDFETFGVHESFSPAYRR
jgi:hypothetical protein